MRPVQDVELEMPRFILKGYDYYDEESGEWKIKDNAPKWAKEEFKEFNKKLNNKPSQDGVMEQY